MNISLNWLKELVDISVSSDALANKFNLMSSEVARLEKLVQATGLVIGHVLSCENHPNADKLHVCQVEVLNEVLQIICGADNVRQGLKVIVALDGAVLPGNFKIKKTKIRGVVSNGMICSLEELGIDKKYHQESGIHELPEDAPIGENPIEYMHLDDEVLELDLTPNRSDLLSMIGVAYDTKALLSSKVHFDEPDVSEESEKNPVAVFTETKGCKSYYARVIKNVTIKESPYWLKSRLIASGIRPINNIVDITNYVMLEYGQPLHAFDYDKIKTGKIVVRDAFDEEEMTTLDGKKRRLNSEDIVITDGEKVLALAGVMGGLDTEVVSTTSTILLESATFDPIKVRKTSKSQDLRSESSIRFERGLDPKRTAIAASRAAMLFKALADGKILKNVNYFDTHNYTELPIKLSLEQIRKVTGYAYKVMDLQDIFSRLSFEYQILGETFVVFIPSRRQDILTYQDLIEEVVRIFGYHAIPLSYPNTPTNGYLTLKQKLRRVIRNTLDDFGLDEVVTYSLVSKEKAVQFDLKKIPVIKLYNPMSEDKNHLRHSLLPSMLEVLSYNLSRKMENVHLFELGKGYLPSQEIELVSGVMTGLYHESLWQGKKESVDFYAMKGLLLALFEKVNIENILIAKPETDLPNMHPGICAEIIIGGKFVGFFGKLHPEMELNFNLPSTFVFELNLGLIVEASKQNIIMEPIAKYPSVSRDIAIVLDANTNASEIVSVVKEAGKKTLHSVKIFDVYQGDKIEKDKKSVAISLVFQDYTKTLSTEEIDQIVNRIVKQLELKLSATLRS
ncbi:MAG: phenylalanine--tRNA ligase subunit beta [Firmicutes bacterium]|nr:phenylalanine--tRNA ligase subunit beta [Bacillota bacterium]